MFWRKDVKFDEKSLPDFMKELVKQAKLYDELTMMSKSRKQQRMEENSSDDDEPPVPKLKRKTKSKLRDTESRKKQKANSEIHNKEVGKAPDARPSPPKCLNEDCPELHWLKDCKNTPKEKKNQLYREYREAKKRKVSFEGAVKHLKHTNVTEHSALFTATFAHGAVDAVVLADQGADSNFIPSSIFEALRKADGNLKFSKLDAPKKFCGVNKQTLITCRATVKASIELRIRHGTKLLLRNLVWFVTNEDIDQAIIGRPVLDAIGCDNRKILASAADQNGGVIDVPSALQGRLKDKPANTIASLILHEPSGIFHSHAGREDDNIPDGKVYLEIGEDEPGECDGHLDKAVQHAIENGMSEEGADRLKVLFKKYRSVFE